MQNLNELIVLGIVFLSVIVFSCVFLPEFFFQKKVVKKEEDAIVDDPMARFIEPQRLQQLRYSLSMVIGVVTLALVIIFNFYWGLPICAVLMVIAYHIPKWSIDKKIKKRNDEFEMGMLDFTILIANSLRAGIALPSAIEMAIQTVGGAINEEFTIVLREHRLGVDLVESIERLNKRIKSENLQLFSATVCVTMRTGGSMADVLDHVVQNHLNGEQVLVGPFSARVSSAQTMELSMASSVASPAARNSRFSLSSLTQEICMISLSQGPITLAVEKPIKTSPLP